MDLGLRLGINVRNSRELDRTNITSRANQTSLLSEFNRRKFPLSLAPLTSLPSPTYLHPRTSCLNSLINQVPITHHAQGDILDKLW